jgi:hypothetical protein
VAEIEALAARPIAESYLVKVREQLRRGHEVDLEDNEHWVGELADAYRWNDDPREIVDLAPLLARANAAGIQAAARRYLGLDRYTLGVLRPAGANALPPARAHGSDRACDRQPRRRVRAGHAGRVRPSESRTFDGRAALHAGPGRRTERH